MSATYGSLLEAATAHLRTGNQQVQRRRFDSADEACEAVCAYYGLLDAVRRQVWALIGPARLAGVAASQNPHPVEVAALSLADLLPDDPDRGISRHGGVPVSRHPWDDAKRCLHAAADLLSTHVTGAGAAYTPDAFRVWDDVARHGGLGRLGGFAVSLLSVQDALALRVGQAGVHWARVGRWLPVSRALEGAVDLVRAAEVTGATGGELDGLRPATGRIRTGRPLDELADRVARIRRTAWNLREQPDYSVRTLAAVAQTGLVVTAHTAAFHGVDLRAPSIATSDLSARRTAAWLRLSTDLRGYLGAGPGNAQLGRDAAAVRDVLAGLLPDRRVDGDRGTSADPAERELGGTLHAACVGLAQAADWNAATFARLARSGQVYVPTRDLTRDETSESPELADAYLNRRVMAVVAPSARTEATLDRYRHVVTLGIEPFAPPASQPPAHDTSCSAHSTRKALTAGGSAGTAVAACRSHQVAQHRHADAYAARVVDAVEASTAAAISSREWSSSHAGGGSGVPMARGGVLIAPGYAPRRQAQKGP